MVVITIQCNDRVRASVASCAVYNQTVGHAFREACYALDTYGYGLVCERYETIFDFDHSTGRLVLPICKGKYDCANNLVFAWFTLCTGRIELLAYIS